MRGYIKQKLLRTGAGLPLGKRIQYKILLLTYKCLNGEGPTYLKDLLVPCSNERGMTLRSSQHGLLKMPPFSKLISYGDRSFEVAAPTLWNTIPAYLRNIKTVSDFFKNLKTHLFNQDFRDI